MQSLLCCAFPDRMVLSHALSCAHAQDNEHDTNLNQPPATHHAPGGRPVLARHARSRPPRRRHLRPRRALDANLLPPVVPGAQAAPPQRHLLPDARGSGTPRLSSLLALPSQRNLRPGRAGSARRRPSRAIHRRRPDALPTRRDARCDAIHFAPRLSPGHGSEAPRICPSASPNRFKALMRAGKSITDALYETGYGSSSRVYEGSNAQLGMTPATYRKGGMGMKLGYTIVKSPLGKVLVAATERGVSAVYLGDDETSLVAELGEEYPRAEIAAASNGFERWVKEVLQRIEGRPPHIELPLDLQATAFQRRVWKEL